MRFHTGHTGAGHDSHIQMRHKEKGTVIQDRLLSFHSQAASFFRVKSSMQRIDQGIQLFVAVMAIIFRRVRDHGTGEKILRISGGRCRDRAYIKIKVPVLGISPVICRIIHIHSNADLF